MTIRADNQRRWQLPYGIVTLWSAYVLMFLGGVYLLAREHAAVHHAAAYANESILWDVSQLQRELLRLALLLERTQALSASASPKALADQLDLAWSNLDRLEHGISHAWIHPQSTMAAMVTQLRGLLEHLDRLFQQWHEEPITYASQALPHVTAAHSLANHLMSGVHQQHDANTTLLNQALHSFQQHLVGYAIGLTLLMVLLMSVTWRHLHSEQARHVVLALTARQHSTTLTMHDDGIGFQEGVHKPTGMGLRIMHYRASMIGASLAIHSDASNGTTVVCEWPHSETAGDDGEMQPWRDGVTTDRAR